MLDGIQRNLGGLKRWTRASLTKCSGIVVLRCVYVRFRLNLIVLSWVFLLFFFFFLLHVFFFFSAVHSGAKKTEERISLMFINA